MYSESEFLTHRMHCIYDFPIAENTSVKRKNYLTGNLSPNIITQFVCVKMFHVYNKESEFVCVSVCEKERERGDIYNIWNWNVCNPFALDLHMDSRMIFGCSVEYLREKDVYLCSLYCTDSYWCDMHSNQWIAFAKLFTVPCYIRRLENIHS